MTQNAILTLPTLPKVVDNTIFFDKYPVVAALIFEDPKK